jgi:glutaryl-CoA dehydrogenase
VGNMSGFRGLDFYNMDSLLGEEERQVRDTVRSWVSDRITPIIEEHARNGTFPLDLVPEMGELGFFGAAFTEFGCAGLSQVASGLIMQELERGDSGLRSFVSVQSSLVMWPILQFGSPQQKEQWIPRLRAGEAIGCFGLTEADHGSDPGGLETTARRVKQGWLLNGSKMWITNGTIADVAVVWAKTEDHVVRGFLVEKGTPGYTAPEIHGKYSLRASVTSELVFQDCLIPGENLLPGTTGLRNALQCLNQARYGIAWGAIGAAHDCYSTALNYAMNRVQFGKPIASFQLVQEKLVYMVTEITKAQLLALQLGRLKDRGEARFEQVSLAKQNNVAMALRIARLARDILGASGITSEYSIGRHMNNLESVYTYEGTHDIHTLIVGASITGIEAYR